MYIYLKLKFQFVLECQSSDKFRHRGKWIINSCVGQERIEGASNNSFLIYPWSYNAAAVISSGLSYCFQPEWQQIRLSGSHGWISFICLRELSQKSIQIFRQRLSKWYNRLWGLSKWSGSIVGPFLGWFIIISPLHFKALFVSPKTKENWKNIRWLQVLTITLIIIIIFTHQLLIQIMPWSLIYRAYHSKSMHNQP